MLSFSGTKAKGGMTHEKGSKIRRIGNEESDAELFP
jgi:hypothetical protein